MCDLLLLLIPGQSSSSPTTATPVTLSNKTANRVSICTSLLVPLSHIQSVAHILIACPGLGQFATCNIMHGMAEGTAPAPPSPPSIYVEHAGVQWRLRRVDLNAELMSNFRPRHLFTLHLIFADFWFVQTRRSLSETYRRNRVEDQQLQLMTLMRMCQVQWWWLMGPRRKRVRERCSNKRIVVIETNRYTYGS